MSDTLPTSLPRQDLSNNSAPKDESHSERPTPRTRVECDCGNTVTLSHLGVHQRGYECRVRSVIKRFERRNLKPTTASRAEWLQKTFGIKPMFGPVTFHSGGPRRRSKVTNGHWVPKDYAEALEGSQTQNASRLSAMLRYAQTRIACSDMMTLGIDKTTVVICNGAYPVVQAIRGLLALSPKACKNNPYAHLELIISFEV